MNETGGRSKDQTIHGAAGKRAPKQPYRRPTIEEYGDLKDITQAVGLSGNSDGGLLTSLLNIVNRTSILNLLG